MKSFKGWRFWGIGVVSGLGLCTLCGMSWRCPLPSHSQLPKVSSLAPDFTLTDYKGKTYRLSDFRGKKVLLNFFCGCGACAELAATWEKIQR
ncbi:MAG: peroxiredoxin family protein [Abditibacteriales bacterium]|nr:peroxiredoxin family protein [Abditibacteriales bacterium]